MGLRLTALAVGLLGASCMTKGQTSSLVITAVLGQTYAAPVAPATVGTCSCPTPSGGAGGELDFLSAGSTGLAPCLQIENRMPNNANSTVRLNTNDFQIEELHLTYENVGGPPAALPAGEIVVPSNGIVPAGAKVTVPAVLVPASVGATLPARSAVRVHAYFRGRLLDHSLVKSSEYEYIVIGCGGSCAAQCMSAAY
jgi:hypothetical protein